MPSPPINTSGRSLGPIRLHGNAASASSDAVVRQRRPDIKLLLTSGYVGQEGVPSDLPFVPKPWRVDQVARAVGLRSYQVP